MQRIWGWLYLEKFFFYTQWARRQRKCMYERTVRPVHTNPFSNDNGTVLLRIRLSSTLQLLKRSPKTETFENALQSGAIWKRCFLKAQFSSVDGENDAIWKRRFHQHTHDRAQDHSTVSFQNSWQTLPCGFNFAPISRADILKCACVEFIWTWVLGYKNGYGVVALRFENDKCGSKSDFLKTEHFVWNGLVWTGPETLL